MLHRFNVSLRCDAGWRLSPVNGKTDVFQISTVSLLACRVNLGTTFAAPQYFCICLTCCGGTDSQVDRNGGCLRFLGIPSGCKDAYPRLLFGNEKNAMINVRRGQSCSCKAVHAYAIVTPNTWFDLSFPHLSLLIYIMRIWS